MKKYLYFPLIALLLAALNLHAQNEASFYATTTTEAAEALKLLYPNEVEILGNKSGEAAVLLSPAAAETLHHSVNTHGPGYVYMASEAKALEMIERETLLPRTTAVLFDITEDALVLQSLDLVNPDNIEEHILDLEAYGTRFHTKPTATQAVLDLQDKWQTMATDAGRTDVSVRIVDHVGTNMPSAVMTIQGADEPDEFVIIGGHIDSTANPSNNNAPGADDDASGIATITEVARVLFEMGYVPSKTVEFMAFAAEEIGLVGSGEIAEEYANNGVNVVSFVQMDMTLYPGSSEDVYITTDPYNSANLNNFLMALMDHYNDSGPHEFSYGTTICNYGCSDHYRWAQEGYEAAFPFEAAFSDSNPFIHSPNDTYDFVGNPDHSVKFAKLGLEYIIETAKGETLATEDFSAEAVGVFVKDRRLSFYLTNNDSAFKTLSVYGITGQKLLETQLSGQSGNIGLQQLSQGFYIARFSLENNRSVTKKFVLN